jgi:hypothetical protein
MPTWSDLKDRVQRELDLADEDFVSETELLDYANRAINKAESIILNLNEDYFLAEPATITLISGTSTYSLPSDIYAQKIRFIQYDNGSKDYQIKKLRNFAEIPNIDTAADYQYVVTNSYSSGVKLRLYPTPAENGAYISIWYLRSSRALTADADTIDLPEAYDYITQYMKDMCINKERFQPDAPPSANLMKEEELLIASLHQRHVDDPIVSLDDVAYYTDSEV